MSADVIKAWGQSTAVLLAAAGELAPERREELAFQVGRAVARLASAKLGERDGEAFADAVACGIAEATGGAFGALAEGEDLPDVIG